MDFNQAKDAILLALLAGIGGYISVQFRDAAKTIDQRLGEMAHSVNALNVRIAQVVEMVAHHKETLGEHATRIKKLESKE